jgi:7,8-dihydropterin-6-yl-methyl-4-(beta-D-ribofuranosyl)aminobenzene 5'-phosphate synthase
MRITTLIENVVNSPKLVAEHGLSLYIETDNRKILFDTGQSGLFLQNAQTLGISIQDIDCLVLSHGHYDHTGGLYPFLEKNSKAKVYAKRNLFVPKYSGKTRFIGTLARQELLKNRMIYPDSITEIADDVFIMPETHIYDTVDTNFKNLYRKVNDEFIPDEFDDELFVVIRQNDKINTITACSHRGITNICTTVTEHFNLPVGLILGGFHMKDCLTEQYVNIMHYFRNLQPQSIGACHCTGLEKFAEMHSECDSHIFYNYTGNMVNI